MPKFPLTSKWYLLLNMCTLHRTQAISSKDAIPQTEVQIHHEMKTVVDKKGVERLLITVTYFNY